MRQWTVDAFASGPFKGNPACVVEAFEMGNGWPADGWIQALAAENNQAETAYLLRTNDPARFGLRWFTPAVEMPLCGHATLAAAQVLFFELGLDVPQLSFDTRSGVLTVRRAGDSLEMDFPADPPRATSVPAGLAEALGVTPIEVWAGAYLVAILQDEAAVRAVAPDLGALVKIDGEATGARVRWSWWRWPTRARLTMSQPVLCAGLRHPRGPGDRFGALHLVAALWRQAGPRHPGVSSGLSGAGRRSRM